MNGTAIAPLPDLRDRQSAPLAKVVDQVIEAIMPWLLGQSVRMVAVFCWMFAEPPTTSPHLSPTGS